MTAPENAVAEDEKVVLLRPLRCTVKADWKYVMGMVVKKYAPVCRGRAIVGALGVWVKLDFGGDGAAQYLVRDTGASVAGRGRGSNQIRDWVRVQSWSRSRSTLLPTAISSTPNDSL